MSDTTNTTPGAEDAPGIPRWVYLFGGVLLLLVVAFVVLHLIGRGLGGHGP